MFKSTQCSLLMGITMECAIIMNTTSYAQMSYVVSRIHNYGIFLVNMEGEKHLNDFCCHWFC